MKNFIFVAIFILTLTPCVSFASEFKWVNKFSFLSDYYSRGISQTLERPAPQFESIIFHSSGLFAGMFVSRVEFADGDEADQELDFYAAYNNTIGKWYYRLGAIYFMYPNSDEGLDYNFWEIDSAVGYDFGPVYSEVSLRYSPDHFGGSGQERYAKLIAQIPVNENLKMKSHIAHRSVEDNEVFFGIPDSFDWEVGFEYNTPFKGMDLLFKYVDSSFTEGDCIVRGICNERFILGISYTF